MFSISQLSEKVDALYPDIVNKLAEFVALPSVSSAPDQSKIADSAAQVAGFFQELGMEVAIRQAQCNDGSMGRPAVIAKKHISDDRPTVLLYAHHDVQPAGPLQRWDSDPFQAEIRGDRMYGRGASDDGAGIMVHLGALAALGDDCPVNVTCYIEGEEEVGSPSFRNFLELYRKDLNADVIVVADSNNWRVGEPAITTSLRGVAEVEVHLKVLNTALHSGAYGGPILDAVSLSCILISKLFDETGAVAVPGLGGKTESEVDYPEELFRQDSGVVPGYKLNGRGSIASRLWTQPALAVIGWDQRDIATAANAIQPETTFRLSMRVVPGEDAAESVEKLRDYLIANAPFGAEVSVSIIEHGPSYQAESSQAEENLKWALETAFNHPAVAIGCGGAIPMTADFKAVMPQAQVLITGVEDPSTNAHSENESQSLSDLKKAIMAEALLLAKTGGIV